MSYIYISLWVTHFDYTFMYNDLFFIKKLKRVRSKRKYLKYKIFLLFFKSRLRFLSKFNFLTQKFELDVGFFNFEQILKKFIVNDIFIYFLNILKK